MLKFSTSSYDTTVCTLQGTRARGTRRSGMRLLDERKLGGDVPVRQRLDDWDQLRWRVQRDGEWTPDRIDSCVGKARAPILHSVSAAREGQRRNVHGRSSVRTLSQSVTQKRLRYRSASEIRPHLQWARAPRPVGDPHLRRVAPIPSGLRRTDIPSVGRPPVGHVGADE